MLSIRWFNQLAKAERDARTADKLVLLFFHSHNCDGCRKTEGTTFVDKQVAEVIERHCMPISLSVTNDQNLTARYKIDLTPTFILTDCEGRELERWVGFLPPEDFIIQLYLALGLAAFHRKRFKDARAAFEWIIDNRPNSVAAPQARYYMGVTLYKSTGDTSHLKRTWTAMRNRYPNDFWTKKASAWS
ncbi:MAG: hypothetical protein A3J24_01115 [Deltaproteobacteria bacterium RIFCSPLOWO2_02_FULL_53_8]|nr:MAG: hypothetical protein A3J24_01115 [Deltaproteobacteria bacterium RIFCSPLOWO2_02_FULL_53_8]